MSNELTYLRAKKISTNYLELDQNLSLVFQS